MSFYCLTQNIDTGIYTAVNIANLTQTCGGIVAQVDTLNFFENLFTQYFGFDSDLFELIVGSNLVIFAIGHGLGRMMCAWRKAL